MRQILWLSLLVAGCSSAADSRCASLCEPGSDPACDADSVSSCLDACEARISGVSSICATCLLERATFSGEGSPIGLCQIDASCPSGERCDGEISGCTYCSGDAAGRQACELTEIACSTSFRPSTECASLCGG